MKKFKLRRTKAVLAYVTAGTYLLSMNLVGPAVLPEKMGKVKTSIESSYEKGGMKKTLKPRKYVDTRYNTKIRKRI